MLGIKILHDIDLEDLMVTIFLFSCVIPFSLSVHPIRDIILILSLVLG